MGACGAALIADGEGLLTHCNTGGLATVGIGTALGVMRRAHEAGKRVHVFVDERRDPFSRVRGSPPGSSAASGSRTR